MTTVLSMIVSPSIRPLLALAAAAAVGAGAVTSAASASADGGSTSPRSLSILLTNDDGWNAPGITAVRDALVAAGHDVVVVAPATNQSGTSARATFGGPLTVTKPAEGVFAVAGSPADATEFGLSVVFAGAAPDLVISGTNAGQNVGAAVVHSGTVGAAVTALNDGVPAIAVSTEIDFTTGQAPYADTAAFVVRLVDTLTSTSRGAVLPKGVGLNVNYPVVPAGVTPRAAATQTGRGFLDLTYSGASLPVAVGDSATYSIGVNIAVAETERRADTTALSADKVAITAIEADYDLDREAADEVLGKLVRRLG